LLYASLKSAEEPSTRLPGICLRGTRYAEGLGQPLAITRSADCLFTPAADTRHDLRLGVDHHHRRDGDPHCAGEVAVSQDAVTFKTLASSSITPCAASKSKTALHPHLPGDAPGAGV
jgi:hypothetical protein